MNYEMAEKIFVRSLDCFKYATKSSSVFIRRQLFLPQSRKLDWKNQEIHDDKEDYGGNECDS
jgi:hypothetical protein